VKELLLLRHAKSSWDDASLDDFNRPLARRGQKAAPHIGQEMAAKSWVPDRVLVSSAMRTRETWSLVSRELGADAVQARTRKMLYMAPAERILAIIRDVQPETLRLLIVGHNPGLEDLARRLAGPGSDKTALTRLVSKFPTAALARFEFDGPWSALDFSQARLTHFLRPKDIGA